MSDPELAEMERDLALATKGAWRVEPGNPKISRIDIVADDGTIIAHTHTSIPKGDVNLNWHADFRFITKAKINQIRLIDEVRGLLEEVNRLRTVES